MPWLERTRAGAAGIAIAVGILGVGVTAVPAWASGQGAPPPAQALPPGHPNVAGPAVPAGPIPQGQQPGDNDGDDDDTPPMPAGHPAPGQGGAAQGGAPNIFEPPADTENEDPSLPAGTILIELKDATNNPLPHVDISLGILHQSVAKGESREHKSLVTNDQGIARADGLEMGTGIAYRVTVGQGGATFAALPFQLSPLKGQHVVLHVYKVTRDIQEALIVTQGILFCEVKDDRIQVEEAITVFNLGKVAWLADGVTIRLPKTFTALNAQQSMSDQGIDSVDKVGGRLHGTFAPGRSEVQFRWQLPYAGEKDIDFEVGLAPHTAVMRAMAAASQGVRLSVAGFPDPVSRTDAQGQRVLITEKQSRRDELMESIHVKLEGLPSPGPARFVATGIAAFGVFLGIALGARGPNKPGRPVKEKSTRARLLAELLALEEAHRTGDVGPKTYERARRELIDAIARTLQPEPVAKA